MTKDFIIDLISSPWFWLAVVAAVVTIGGNILYPQQTNQDYSSQINEYNDEGKYIDVAIDTLDYKEALAEIERLYPEYEVMSYAAVEEKGIIIFTLRRKETR